MHVGMVTVECSLVLIFIIDTQVAGIGNDGVGKTCLVKNFCEKKVHITTTTTICLM